MPKQIHLAAHFPGVNNTTVWSDPAAGSHIEFDSFVRFAQTAERGKFDFLFLAEGLRLREQEREAERMGVYSARRPMFRRIEPDGVRWADGSFATVDVILWATGFRYAIEHLAPLHLRSPRGGIQLDGTTAVADPRVQLVGYGPSASTIGANRAGRQAALGVSAALSSS